MRTNGISDEELDVIKHDLNVAHLERRTNAKFQYTKGCLVTHALTECNVLNAHRGISLKLKQIRESLQLKPFQKTRVCSYYMTTFCYKGESCPSYIPAITI